MDNATLSRGEWVSSPESWGEPTEDYLPASTNFGGGRGTSGLANGILSRLRRRYEFRGGLVVEDFLQENPNLGVLLLDAYEVIRKREHFGPGTRVALEVVADPDAQEDRQLFVLIRTKFPPRVARAVLAEVDRHWWLDALPQAAGKMELALA